MKQLSKETMDLIKKWDEDENFLSNAFKLLEGEKVFAKRGVYLHEDPGVEDLRVQEIIEYFRDWGKDLVKLLNCCELKKDWDDCIIYRKGYVMSLTGNNATVAYKMMLTRRPVEAESQVASDSQANTQ